MNGLARLGLTHASGVEAAVARIEENGQVAVTRRRRVLDARAGLEVARVDGSARGQAPQGGRPKLGFGQRDGSDTSNTSDKTAAAVTTNRAERRRFPWDLSPATGATMLLGAAEKQRTPT